MERGATGGKSLIRISLASTERAEIPLTYVYREQLEVDDELRAGDWNTNDERYYHLTVLSGDHFEVDNRTVFEELKALTISGPGWAFIRK